MLTKVPCKIKRIFVSGVKSLAMNWSLAIGTQQASFSQMSEYVIIIVTHESPIILSNSQVVESMKILQSLPQNMRIL